MADSFTLLVGKLRACDNMGCKQPLKLVEPAILRGNPTLPYIPEHRIRMWIVFFSNSHSDPFSNRATMRAMKSFLGNLHHRTIGTSQAGQPPSGPKSICCVLGKPNYERYTYENIRISELLRNHRVYYICMWFFSTEVLVDTVIEEKDNFYSSKGNR